jgi:hypothetical protein
MDTRTQRRAPCGSTPQGSCWDRLRRLSDGVLCVFKHSYGWRWTTWPSIDTRSQGSGPALLAYHGPKGGPEGRCVTKCSGVFALTLTQNAGMPIPGPRG